MKMVKVRLEAPSGNELPPNWLMQIWFSSPAVDGSGIIVSVNGSKVIISIFFYHGMEKNLLVLN
jgi:hypothetical protein